ncbi:MAG: hypothetical protein ACKOYL_14500, partial [Actinomycetota bacterium]
MSRAVGSTTAVASVGAATPMMNVATRRRDALALRIGVDAGEAFLHDGDRQLPVLRVDRAAG